QRPQDRRLAGAVRPDETRDGALLDVEVESAEDVSAAVAGDHLLETEQRHVPRYASSTRGSDWISAGRPSASFVPWSSTITGSQRRITRLMLGSTIRKVRPCACCSRSCRARRVGSGRRTGRPSNLTLPASAAR